MTTHTWAIGEDDDTAICQDCGHRFLAHYDVHGPGCLGGRFCCCDPMPTTGCASCDQGLPKDGAPVDFSARGAGGGR